MRSATLILIAAVMVLYLSMVFTSVESCKGRPSRSKCSGPLDVGNNRKRKCKKSANKIMWHYDSAIKKCRRFHYKGCGGNNNRWCNQQSCQACRRR